MGSIGSQIDELIFDDCDTIVLTVLMNFIWIFVWSRKKAENMCLEHAHVHQGLGLKKEMYQGYDEQTVYTWIYGIEILPAL